MFRVLPWLLLAWAAACSLPPAGDATTETASTARWPLPPAQLRIDNPGGFELTVAVVLGDETIEVARPGRAPAVTLSLAPAAYVVSVHTRHGERELAAPLLPASLGADRTLTLHVPTRSARFITDAYREYTFVPAGPAVIGDTLGVGQEDERPARIVDVAAFWLGSTEVTNLEYAEFLTACAHVDPTWCDFGSRKCRLARGDDGKWTTTASGLPVVTVSLAGAEAYCAWRTAVTSVQHRLPTEVEWEKAARGPRSYVFAYGNVYRRTAANQESGTLNEIRGYLPTGLFLFDMTGNAFEWTSDPYRARPDAEPVPGFQVLRGGSFVLDGMYLRNSFRMRQRPDVRSDDIGFRVLREVQPGDLEDDA